MLRAIQPRLRFATEGQQLLALVGQAEHEASQLRVEQTGRHRAGPAFEFLSYSDQTKMRRGCRCAGKSESGESGIETRRRD